MANRDNTFCIDSPEQAQPTDGVRTHVQFVTGVDEKRNLPDDSVSDDSRGPMAIIDKCVTKQGICMHG